LSVLRPIYACPSQRAVVFGKKRTRRGGDDGDERERNERASEAGAGSVLRDGAGEAERAIGGPDAETAEQEHATEPTAQEEFDVMSEAAQEVVRLRGDLERAQSELATARASADERARELQRTPTREMQVARDAALGEVELIDLQIRRIEADIASASEAERLARIEALLRDHEGVHEAAREAEARLLGHLVGSEEALGELKALRRRSRKTTAHLRAAGDTESLPQLGLRMDNQLARRLAALQERYQRALHPILG
jgi:hypothetical protein